MPRHCVPLPKLLAVALLAMLPALSAMAEPQSQRGGRDRGAQQQGDSEQRDSLSDAVRRVERDTRGEVLSAERVQFDGRDMHRVKVVDDQGRVRVFMQDPERRDAAPRATRTGFDPSQARRPSTPTRDDDD